MDQNFSTCTSAHLVSDFPAAWDLTKLQGLAFQRMVRSLALCLVHHLCLARKHLILWSRLFYGHQPGQHLQTEGPCRSFLLFLLYHTCHSLITNVLVFFFFPSTLVLMKLQRRSRVCPLLSAICSSPRSLRRWIYTSWVGNWTEEWGNKGKKDERRQEGRQATITQMSLWLAHLLKRLPISMFAPQPLMRVRTSEWKCEKNYYFAKSQMFPMKVS